MRILTVDDHMLFRRCMVDFLEAHEGIEVVGEAASPDRALDLMRTVAPDLALVDIDLGGQDGVVLAETMVQRWPSCTVVLLTACEDEAQMLRAMNAGVSGYLVKDIHPEHLVAALQLVMDGDTVFSKAFMEKHVRGRTRPTGALAGEAKTKLSEREVEVLRLVSDGLMDKQVADRLGISESTIKNHMRSIRRKLGASNRVQASLIAVQTGLIVKT